MSALDAVKGVLTPAVRRWIYNVAIAAGPLLIAYGVLERELWASWLAVITAVLVPGLARANVTEDTTEDAPRHALE